MAHYDYIFPVSFAPCSTATRARIEDSAFAREVEEPTIFPVSDLTILYGLGLLDRFSTWYGIAFPV